MQRFPLGSPPLLVILLLGLNIYCNHGVQSLSVHRHSRLWSSSRQFFLLGRTQPTNSHSRRSLRVFGVTASSSDDDTLGPIDSAGLQQNQYGDFALRHLSPCEREALGNTTEMESTRLLLELQDADNGRDSPESKNGVEQECIEVMIQLAQLGKAKTAETFYSQLMDTNRQDISRQGNTTMLRILIHAWSNRMRLMARNSPSSQGAASRAREVLNRMIGMNDEECGLACLDNSDFETVIQNYLYLQPSKIDQIYGVWKDWQAVVAIKRVDPPSALLNAQIIRSIANLHNKSWQMMLERAEIARTMADVALAESLRDDQDHQRDDEDVLNIYNALLEVWSKALPPPAKQDQVSEEMQQSVSHRTEAILDEMKHYGIQPNMQTYASVLYAFCKAGRLQQAWTYWQAWKDDVLNVENHRYHGMKIDGRCLPMLIQSTAKYAQEYFEEEEEEEEGAKHGRSPQDYTILATEALFDMWALYDRGFAEMKPEVDLYTRLLCGWTNPHFQSISMEYAKSLVQSLNERYQILRWSTLRPDMKFYNARIGVVRSYFGNAAMSISDEAGAIVRQMEHESMDNPLVAPDTRVYNFLIDACLSDGSILGVERAEQTLTKMIDVSAAVSSSRRISPNGRSFASVIRSFSQFDTGKAEYWLDRMEESFIPSSALFEEVILQCCRQAAQPSESRKQQAERAFRLLNRMVELSEATDNPKLLPDQDVYASVIEAWQGLDGETKDEIERLRESHNDLLDIAIREGHQINSDDDVFRTMKDFGGSFRASRQPEANTFTFNLILRQIAHCSGKIKPEAGQIAEEIFVYMLDAYFNKNRVNLRPDLVTFNTVILAMKRQPEGAHAFLDNLKQLKQRGILLDLEPDLISYNQVIDAYKNSGKAGSAERAERVYNDLVQLYEATNNERYQPDTITFCSLLGAYARAGNSERAEELLLRWIKESKVDSSKNVAPDSTCYDQVLYALAKDGSARNTKRPDMLLNLLEDKTSSVSPTTTTYNIVLHGMANSGDFSAPFRAMKLVERMKSGKLGKKARPDSVTYTTAARVICRLGSRAVVQTLETLIDEAIESPGVETDVTFFQNILSSLAYCMHEGIIQLANSLIEKRMPELGIKPSLFAYNGLLSCYAKRGMWEEAESSLKKLEMEGRNVTPTVQTYTLVLDAYAKSEDPVCLQKAEDLMKHMQDSKLCQPDVKSYTALIQKYARSDVPLKAKRAQAVLQRMTKEGTHGVRPTVVTYNAILNACEYTRSEDLTEKEEAFTVACLTFDEMRKLSHINPTHTTYGSFLGSITTLMPRSDARNEIAELVFKRCCKDGQVSQYVLRKLKASVSATRYRQMLGGRKEDKLPRAWTANVRDRKNERSSVRRKSFSRGIGNKSRSVSFNSHR